MPVSITITRPTYNDNDTLDAATFDSVTISSATVPDATAITLGVVQLAGDLAGTAAAPTIKANVGLTGVPTAPTAVATTNTTQIATTAFVQTNSLAIANNLSDLASAQTARTVGLGFSDNVNWHTTPCGATFGDADADVEVFIGSANTEGLYLKKFLGGAAEIGTYAKARPLTMVAQEFNVNVPSLDFALKAYTNGRVRAGAGADDGVSAFQVNGDLCVDGTLATTVSAGALAMPATCEKFLYLRSAATLYKIPLCKN